MPAHLKENFESWKVKKDRKQTIKSVQSFAMEVLNLV